MISAIKTPQSDNWSVIIDAYCYIRIEDVTLFEKGKIPVAVTGTIEKVKNNSKGLFIGSRVIVLGTVEESCSIEKIEADIDNVYAIPNEISYRDATAAIKYICKINTILEQNAPLDSNYIVLSDNKEFSSILDALGYNKSKKEDADIIISANADDENLIGRKTNARLIIWDETGKTNQNEHLPGADWNRLIGMDKNIKYPYEYIHTRIEKNLQILFSLLRCGKLEIDNIDQIFEIKEEQREKIERHEIKVDEFKPYDAIIKCRKKPLIATYITNGGDGDIRNLVEKINGIIGYNHRKITMSDDQKKCMIIYPDGSIASIIIVDRRDTNYTELHFDGITIVSDGKCIHCY